MNSRIVLGLAVLFACAFLSSASALKTDDTKLASIPKTVNFPVAAASATEIDNVARQEIEATPVPIMAAPIRAEHRMMRRARRRMRLRNRRMNMRMRRRNRRQRMRVRRMRRRARRVARRAPRVAPVMSPVEEATPAPSAEPLV